MGKEDRIKYGDKAIELGLVPIVFGWIKRLFTKKDKRK